MKIAGILLVLIATVLQLTAFIIYGMHVFGSETLPNTSSWLLWSYLSVLNAFAYYHDSGGNWTKSGVAIVNAFAMTVTFVFSLWIGSISFPPMHDYPYLIMGLIASLVWLRYSAGVAQFILQAAFTIAFIPTYIDLWGNPMLEQPLPWILWVTSFFIGIVVVALRWRGRYMEIMYPTVAFLRIGALLLLIYWSSFFHSLISQ